MTSRTFGGEQTLPDLPGLVGSDLSEPDYIGVEAEKDRRETYKYIFFNKSILKVSLVYSSILLEGTLL